MRFRLDSQHYHEDKLLEPGTEVGDDCDIAWRYPKDVHQTDDHGNEVVIKAGTAMPPSAQMTPLDEEAKRMVRDWFKTDKPARDPMVKIPLQGTGDKVKVEAPGTPRPGTSPQTVHKEILAQNIPPSSATPPSSREPIKPIVPAK